MFGDQFLYSHEISGARSVGISFIGYNQGAVTINSQGNVIVDGPILNPTGTTTITSQGSIETDGNTGVVGGNKVVLQAQSGIGDSGGAAASRRRAGFDSDSIRSQSGTRGNLVSTSNNTIDTGPVGGSQDRRRVTYNDEGNSRDRLAANGANYYVNYNATTATIQLYDNQLHASRRRLAGLVDLKCGGGRHCAEFTITTARREQSHATTEPGAIDLAQVARRRRLPINNVMSQSLGRGDIVLARQHRRRAAAGRGSSRAARSR